MEEICSKNDLIKDRSIALIPGHSVTYQMTPLSLSKDFRIFFFFYTKSVGFTGFQIKECRIGIGRAQVVLLQGEKSEIKYKKKALYKLAQGRSSYARRYTVLFSLSLFLL